MRDSVAAIFVIMIDYEKEQIAVLETSGFSDTPVMTMNGWKAIKNIRVGDTVFNKNGNPDEVTEISLNVEMVYKIKFDNNFSVELPETSMLPSVLCGYHKKHGFEVHTVKEIIAKKEKSKGLNGYHLPKIEVFNGFSDSENVVLSIDPYVLGAWLGDGHSSCGMITNMYDEVFSEIESRGYSIGKDVSGGGTGKAKSRTILKLSTELKKYNLLGNKHVPIEFLISGKTKLKDIICGYMDTDGYFNKTRKRYHLSTTRSKQVTFLIRMLSSYGIKPTVIATKTKCGEKTIPSFEVTFSSNENFFKQRKINFVPPKHFKGDLMIKSFEPIGEKEVMKIKTRSGEPILFGNNLLEIKL